MSKVHGAQLEVSTVPSGQDGLRKLELQGGSAKRTEFTAGLAEGLTSFSMKDPRYSLSQEGVAFHQEPDLRWSGREVKLLCGFEQIS